MKKLSILFFLVCNMSLAQPELSDPMATRKTRKVYENLYNIAKGGTLFGHQDALAYGSTWWDEKGRSDVKEVTEKYPAIIGWDLGKLGSPRNIDSVSFESMRKGILYAYRKKALNTISWHMDSPYTGESSWDKSRTIEEILPGGSAHQKYLEKLNLFADFIKRCKKGKIPMVFRPFHEQNGSWFWWGADYRSSEQYIQLWRFTVDYLRNEKGLHNLIYAYSPDRSRLENDQFNETYLKDYPGDDYVDVLGLDDYWDVGSRHNKAPRAEQAAQLTASIRSITSLAREKNKVAALTETGNAGLKHDNWFTSVLLAPIKAAAPDNQIAWLLVWRNANPEYHYVPYPGHPQEPDFKAFEADDQTLFLGDVKNSYR